MKILTGNQIKEADRQTIIQRPVDSVDLMEEASIALIHAFFEEIGNDKVCKWLILAGKGNNGGDGLAVARLLNEKGENVEVALAFPKEKMTEETRINLERLPKEVHVKSLNSVSDLNLDVENESTIVIDALLGSGVRGEVREPLASIIKDINAAGVRIWSIDLPSGMSTEPAGSENLESRFDTVICAEKTFTIAFPKLSMMFPETGSCAGKIITVPLNLDSQYLEHSSSRYFWVDSETVRKIEKKHPRTEFMHKGNAGHALLVCGSVGMAGAAVLSSGGALRSGCGLVTLHLPSSERSVVHQVHPAVIVSGDPSSHFSRLPEHPEKYTAAGAGCGMGQNEESADALLRLMEWGLPMVLDADALNILASHPDFFRAVPEGSVLTPHIGELKRLVGKWKNLEDKLSRVVKLASRLNCCIVVKGAHTMTVTPDGRMLFNGNGNPGMAKGGCGDVLAGLITGLLAYGYSAEDAAVLGVWRHGAAGDAAAKIYGEDAMNSEDLLYPGGY